MAVNHALVLCVPVRLPDFPRYVQFLAEQQNKLFCIVDMQCQFKPTGNQNGHQLGTSSISLDSLCICALTSSASWDQFSIQDKRFCSINRQFYSMDRQFYLLNG